MMNTNRIIEPNYTVTALVPYVSQNPKRLGFLDKIELYIEDAYIKKYKYYYLYLVITFVAAVVSAEVFSRFPMLSKAFSDNLWRDYLNLGFSFQFLYNAFFCHAITVVVSFLAGFTVFSLPVSIICFCRIMLSAFYVLSSVVTLNSFGINHSFSLILIFALFVFVSIIFFTETALSYGSFCEEEKYSSFIRYIVVFIMYICISPCIIKLGISIIQSI